MLFTRVKLVLLRIVLWTVRAISSVVTIAPIVLALSLRPLRYFGNIVFRYAVVPLYKVGLLMSKRMERVIRSSKNGMLWVFTARRTVHAVFVLLLFFVLTQNVLAKDISPDEFGQNSLILTLVDAESQDIVETADSVAYTNNTISDELGSLDAQNASGETLNPVDSEIATINQGSIVQPTLTGSAPSAVFNSEESHIVNEGETLSEIAALYGVRVQTLLDENGLTETSFIRPGQKLTILVTPSGKAVRHQVKSGDTISSIAKAYGVSEESITSFNNLNDADSLALGQTLIIDGGSKPAPRASTTLARVSNFLSTPIATGSPASGPSGKFGWPAPGRSVTQGVRAGHIAIDVDCESSQSLFAAESGTVAAAGWSGGYGNRIVLNHGGGIQTLYGHFAKLYVSAGQSVSRGQAIGQCGTTGYSTGTHLHFEVRVGGRPVNPWSYLR